MFFKRFRIQVMLRVLLLCATVFAFVYLLERTAHYSLVATLGLLVVVQVVATVGFVEKSNRELRRFFAAVKQEDFSRSFSGRGLSPSFAELVDDFNEVIRKIRETRSQREESHRYLQTIIHHVGIGLITFAPDGKVHMINTAAKRLLKVAHLKNIGNLRSLSPALVQTLYTLAPGNKALVKIDEGALDLVIRSAEFRLQDRLYHLVSLENIQRELEEKELEAWQTLIRVLTHEIMNSMTPITSMTATVIDLLDQHFPDDGESREPALSAEDIDDIKEAVKTVNKRSRSLSEFVDSYRNLTLIPRPRFSVVSIEELLLRVEKLMNSKLDEKGIDLHWSVEPHTLELTADPGLVEQVLINLLLNAADALEGRDNPTITIDAGLDDIGRVTVAVEDNGAGIVKEALDKVFIPFFTTKKGGSGIGLALSRQIMKLHNGTITVHSVPDQKTIFTLKF